MLKKNDTENKKKERNLLIYYSITKNKMKTQIKKYAGVLLASAVVVTGIASAAVTPIPTISNTFAVAGQVIKSADLNKLAEAVNILDLRTVSINIDQIKVNEQGLVAIGYNSSILPANDTATLRIQGQHGTSAITLQSFNGGTNPSGYLSLWASEPGHTLNGVGIGGNVQNYANIEDGSTKSFVRQDKTVGASLIRMINGNTYFQIIDTNDSIGTPLVINNTGTVGLETLSGTGNAYACVDNLGTLYRSTTPCN
ncbi:MAG: hypothetical protein WBP45_04115 [Daejeonella sp.]